MTTNTNANPLAQATAHFIATLGPDYAPVARVRVRILGPSEKAGFFRCLDEHGQRLTIHRQKLKAIQA